MEVRERKGKLIQKLIFAAVLAIIFIAAFLTIMSGIEINNTYNKMVEEELKVAVEQLASEMNKVWDGDWSMVDGSVYKGEENIMEEYGQIMDELKASTGVEYSLFYGKERVITTLKDSSGKKAVGYNISEAVASHVITNKQTYFLKTTPAGATENYYCYYAPMYNSDGSVVGMVFTGRESDSVSASIRAIIMQMVVISLFVTIITSVVGIVVANKSSGTCCFTLGII